ncbi:MAG: WD40 repeat domain-containing protein [Solirubrobacteraceae bacterium]
MAPCSAFASAPTTFTPAPGSPLWVGQGPQEAFSPNGALLAAGTAMFSVGPSGALSQIGSSVPDQYADAVAFSPNGKLLAAADLYGATPAGGKTVSIFSVSGSGALTAVPGSPFTVGAQPNDLAFSPGGNLLAVSVEGNDAPALEIFSVSAAGALTPATGSPYSISASQLAFSPGGGLLAAVNVNNGVTMYAVGSSGALTQIGSPTKAFGAAASDAAFNPAGNLLAVSNFSGGVTMYSVASSGALTAVGSGPYDASLQSNSVAFSDDGATVAATRNDAPGVAALSVGPSGSLTELAGSPYSTPAPPDNVAFSQTGLLSTDDDESNLTVLVPASTSSATNWVGAIGSAGYDLAGWNGSSDLISMPNVSVDLVQGSRTVWATGTSDPRALASPDGSSRNAAAYTDPTEVEVKLTFEAAYTGNLRLYVVDWNASGIFETVGIGSRATTFAPEYGAPAQGVWATFPVNVAAGGSITITATSDTLAPAVLSGIFLGDAGSPPGTSTQAPQGSWVGSYGAAGYDLAAWSGGNDVVSMPGVSASLVQGSRWVWASGSSDVRALEDAGGDTRTAACLYSSSQVEVELSFSSAYSGNLELYAVDWDDLGRSETITAGGVSARLSSFANGAWVTVPITQTAGSTLLITVTNTGPVNAVLSGVFLGGPPAAGPTPSESPQGNWSGTYGASGYDLAAWNGGSDLTVMPGVTATLAQGSRYVWASSTTDVRALADPAGARAATTWYDPNQVEVQLTFSSAYTGNLELYAVDWDDLGRVETVTAGSQTATLTSFSNGDWVTFPITQAPNSTLTITVSHLSGANAVLSGIFLGGPGGPVPTTQPQGNWVGTFGTTGYDLLGWNGASDLVSLPAGVTTTLVQGSRHVWASSTTDVRALADPAGARAATTAYDPNQVEVQLTFSSAYTGNLELYAVDWDDLGRIESITVGGQTSFLVDFNNGAWVSFPNLSVAAGGTLTITVKDLSGVNAVLAGVFLN